MAQAVSLSCSPPPTSNHACPSRISITQATFNRMLPDSHIGVADTGADHMYFSKDAPVEHKNKSAPTINVSIANGIKSTSSATAQLKNKNVPLAARQGHIMPEFPRTLFGIAPLCDAGLSVTFTKYHVKAYDQAGNVVIEGWRNPKEAPDWYLPLVDENYNSDDNSLFSC